MEVVKGLNVFMLSGDGDYLGASFKDRKQGDSLIACERDGRPIPAGTQIDGWYYPDDGERDPVLTDIGELGCGITLLLHRPRTDVLRPMLQQVGNILPMTPWRGETFEAFICNMQLDAIDGDHMEYYPEDHPIFYDLIRRYAFKADAVQDATVFRVQGMFGHLFATDRFIDLVQEHGLTGLKALPLWSSDTGPIGELEDPMVEMPRFLPGFGTTPDEKRAIMRAILAKRDGHQ